MKKKYTKTETVQWLLNLVTNDLTELELDAHRGEIKGEALRTRIAAIRGRSRAAFHILRKVK